MHILRVYYAFLNYEFIIHNIMLSMQVHFDCPLDIMYNPFKGILNEKLSTVSWPMDIPVGIFLIWLIKFGQITLNIPTPFHRLGPELNK